MQYPLKISYNFSISHVEFYYVRYFTCEMYFTCEVFQFRIWNVFHMHVKCSNSSYVKNFIICEFSERASYSDDIASCFNVCTSIKSLHRWRKASIWANMLVWSSIHPCEEHLICTRLIYKIVIDKQWVEILECNHEDSFWGGAWCPTPSFIAIHRTEYNVMFS